ncbi:acyltransferase family protein [Paenibacillus sp. BR2-3]|uniref:acyltransferase family protein n=1 Tax=Paenibacillus sp. BR2-3 TaxID=3048494 RepID=UPI003977A7D9
MKESENRLYFLDNLRIVLIMLVVAHHAGQPYGGSEGWWYFKTINSPGLGSFFAVNAAFFMSLFFLISAYFVPHSFDKKGIREFLKDRLIRLGIPLILGFFIIIPLLMYSYYINFRDSSFIGIWDYYIKIYFGIGGQPTRWTGPSWPDMNFGHLWFIEHLLVYVFIYTIIRTIMQKYITHKKPPKSFPSQISIILFTFMIAMFTFIVRIWYPIDHWTGFLGVIQTEFAHVTQYMSFFIAGIFAAKNNWIIKIPRSVGVIWLLIGILLALVLYSGEFSIFQKGGLNWGSLTYSVVETYLCSGLSIGLVFLFHRKFNKTNSIFQYLSADVFTVYIFHVPIVVILQYTVENLDVSAYVKFLLVSLFGIILSFLVSHYLIRKIPYSNKVL